MIVDPDAQASDGMKTRVHPSLADFEIIELQLETRGHKGPKAEFGIGWIRIAFEGDAKET